MALPEFEGRYVRKASLRITNAGDGLSDALTVAPKAYHHGEEIALVLRATITQVNHKPERDDDSDLVRVHTAKAVDVVEVSLDDVQEYLSQAADWRRRRQEQESGQTSLLDGADPDPSAADGQGGEPEPELEPEPFGVA